MSLGLEVEAPHKDIMQIGRIARYKRSFVERQAELQHAIDGADREIADTVARYNHHRQGEVVKALVSHGNGVCSNQNHLASFAQVAVVDVVIDGEQAELVLCAHCQLRLVAEHGEKSVRLVTQKENEVKWVITKYLLASDTLPFPVEKWVRARGLPGPILRIMSLGDAGKYCAGYYQNGRRLDI